MDVGSIWPIRTGTPPVCSSPTYRQAWVKTGRPAGNGCPPEAADCGTVISVNWVYVGSAIGAVGAAVYLRDTLRGTTNPTG